MSIRFKCKCGREFAVPDSEAGKRAKCRNCGESILIPRAHRDPHAAPAKAPRRPPASQRPAAAGQTPRSGSPAPAQPEGVFAGSNEIDNSVIAQMSQPAAHGSHGAYQAVGYSSAAPRRVPLAVRLAVGLGVAVAVAAALDAIIVVASGGQADAAVPAAGRGMRMLHAAWLVALVAGCIVAIAAGMGHRVCLGILIGGAFQNIFINTPLLLIGAWSQFSEKLSAQASQTLVLGGVACLVLGVVYVVLLVGLPGSRKYLAGHRKHVASGIVVGFLSGWLIAVTAVPNPGLAATRVVAKPGSMRVVPEAWGGIRPPVPVARKDPRTEAKERLTTIANAMAVYTNRHGRCFPNDLAELVSADCPAETFVLPASGKAAPQVAGGTFAGPIDFVLVMPGYYVGDLPEDPNKLQDFVVCHSDPAWCKNDGGAVLRPPRSGGDQVMYILKGPLEQEVEMTQTWMREKPSRRQPTKPRPTPGAGGKPAPVAIGKRDITHDAQVRLTRISIALAAYLRTHDSRFPKNLGELVSASCQAGTFILPGSGKAEPGVNKSTGEFTGPIDFTYIMAGCNGQELPDEPDKLRDFVVCHSDPDMDIHGAAVVLHPPGTDQAQRVEVLHKASLEQVLETTRTWMSNNPSGAKTEPPPKTEPPSKDE